MASHVKTNAVRLLENAAINFTRFIILKMNKVNYEMFDLPSSSYLL